MNDDLTLLASAYLDGAADADERARVENDPAAFAEVERLRSVRMLMADVEPSSISTREQHLAGALAAWDRIPDAERTGATRDSTPRGIEGAAAAAAATVTAPTRLADRRRTMSTRWLTASAAALVLVLAGGVALQLNGNSEDSDAVSSADESTAAASADAAEAIAPELADGELRSAETELAADADVAGADDLDTAVDAPPPSPEDGLILLLDVDDLASFAGDALDAPSQPDVPAATSGPVDTDGLSDAEEFLLDAAFPLCLGVDRVAGPASYDGVFVVVGIDDSRKLAIAYTIPDCTELARARLDD
ncbi:MAG: hypothetical protein WBP59_07280 [Ilumatobacteraceae bacterium]